ncbi:hypothetical protein CDEST_04002 [Colletotrichum destructivum]|uniref:Uncharacterized protein n=1 Tax=Colletotrichum destructivum TaxID=34406 RepID=A0AAX4I7U2_9PEZI|nr:hypothetical protein CDEST_04002 [Colletotrichum destructivum]
MAGASSSPCQTVTSTGSVCPTFFLKACLALSTIQNRCGCPSTVPTTTVNYPCDGARPTGCMGTSYIYETAVPTCDGHTLPTTVIPTLVTITTPIAPTPVGPVACPTVFTRETVCSTCIQPMCVEFSTISRLCHCPTQVPTITQAFPCGGGCPGGCAATQYFNATETPVCTR